MPNATKAVDPTALLKGKDPVVAETYGRLLAALRTRLGKAAVVVDPKGTCVHLNAGKDGSAFLGVHFRKSAVLLTVKSERPLKGPRVKKAQARSKTRCYNDVLVAAPEEIDAELLGWIEASHALSV